MSELKSARIQVTRFRVIDPDQGTLLPLPAGLAEVVEALRQHAFVSIDAVADEVGQGWVPFECYRKPEFNGKLVHVGDYAVFSLRFDRRMIPAAAYKRAFEDAIDAELERTSKNFLSRDRKKEIAEQVRLKILTRIPPTPTVVDLVWDIQCGTLLVTTHANAPLKAVEALFSSTFSRKIVPFTPSDAVRAEIDPADECEFWRGLMTWLWNRQESTGEYAFADGIVQAQFADRIELSNPNGTVRAVSETQSWEEVRAGIKDGKTISAASLWLSADDEEWDIVLKHSGDVTVKGPKVEQREDDSLESVLLERIYLLKKGLNALDVVAHAYAVAEHGVSPKRLHCATRMEKAGQKLLDSFDAIGGVNKVEIRVPGKEPVPIFERDKGKAEVEGATA